MIYYTLWTHSEVQVVAPLPHASASPAASQQLTDLVEEVNQLKTAIARSPSIDPIVKISVLKDEQNQISKKREELTNQEKVTLDNQAITLQSLEDGRTRDLADKALQKRQEEVAAQQAQIEQSERLKQSQKQIDVIEIDFAKQNAPVVDHVVSTLYQMLRQIAKESGETFSTDLPNDRPALDGSNILKDSKLINGQHVMHVGASKDWEFRLRLSGALNANDYYQGQDRILRFEIRAGLASVLITSPLTRPPAPGLRLQLWVDPRENYRRTMDKPLIQEDCPLTDYRKPIEAMLKKLIQNRYIAAPLKPQR